MKRCKAVTTRAAGSVECSSGGEHEGAHEGTKVEDGIVYRVVWTDPNAPYIEALEQESLPPVSPLLDLIDEPPTRPDVAIVRQKTIATHCACGTEHTADDRELRGGSGMPMIAMVFGELEPDPRFSWARVCIGCGAVYCRIWTGESVSPEPRSCTCPLSQRQRVDFMHAATCPAAFQSP